MLKEEKKKFDSLQVLRGLAALGVVIHHIDQTFFNFSSHIWIIRLFGKHGNFGVDIFFVLSGIIMFFSLSHSRKKGSTFFIDRALRIFPIYWLLTTVYLVSSMFLPQDSIHLQCSTEKIIRSYFLFPQSISGWFPLLYVGWTLVYEMFFYTILSVALMIDKKRSLLITFLVVSALPFVLGDFPLLGHRNILLLEFSVGLSIGYIYQRFQFQRKDKLVRTVVALVTLVAASLLLMFLNKYMELGKAKRIAMAGMILVTFLVIDEYWRLFGKLTIFLVWLGDVSYSTYLLHPIILVWVKLMYDHTNSSILKNALIVVFVLITYLFSIFSYRYIEKNNHLYKLKSKISDYFSKTERMQLSE